MSKRSQSQEPATSTYGASANHGEDVFQASKSKRSPLLRSILSTLATLTLVAAAILAVFTFVLGLHVVGDDYMEPSIANGDAVVFNRQDHEFATGEVAVLEHEDHVTCARVIALEGEKVDIDSDGLIIDGSHQIERGISDQTTQLEGGVSFPLTVPKGSVFVLGDHRTTAVDSRIFGCVQKDDVQGKVIAQFHWPGL